MSEGRGGRGIRQRREWGVRVVSRLVDFPFLTVPRESLDVIKRPFFLAKDSSGCFRNC